MGREIAQVLEAEHEQTGVDRPARDVRELPDRLITALRLGPADRVADIGAGSGYYTLRLASRVPHGRVYAVDLQEALLDSLLITASEAGLRNVVPVRGAVDSPNLADESVDLALVVVSYHEFSHPSEMLSELIGALRTGGRLVVVEYRAEDETIPVDRIHRMSEEQARQEMESVGFEWIENLDVLPQHHVMVFRKPLE
jgi:ubiquinone/menaquinone biosynthesis C-methylase UbiE